MKLGNRRETSNAPNETGVCIEKMRLRQEDGSAEGASRYVERPDGRARRVGVIEGRGAETGVGWIRAGVSKCLQIDTKLHTVNVALISITTKYTKEE